MLIRERKLRSLIREILLEKDLKRIVFDPLSINMPLHRRLLKLFEPGQTPVKVAKFDAEVDTQGTPLQKAFALAAKAMTYADNDEDEAAKLLNMARMQYQKIKQAAGGGQTGSIKVEDLPDLYNLINYEELVTGD